MSAPPPWRCVLCGPAMPLACAASRRPCANRVHRKRVARLRARARSLARLVCSALRARACSLPRAPGVLSRALARSRAERAPVPALRARTARATLPNVQVYRKGDDRARRGDAERAPGRRSRVRAGRPGVRLVWPAAQQPVRRSYARGRGRSEEPARPRDHVRLHSLRRGLVVADLLVSCAPQCTERMQPELQPQEPVHVDANAQEMEKGSRLFSHHVYRDSAASLCIGGVQCIHCCIRAEPSWLT